MSAPVRDSYAFCESTVQDAISAYNSKQYKSIRATADAFNLPESTLRKRMSGRISRSRAHEYRQSLSPAEEKTLVRWISQLTITGFPASPALVVEMAEEIRHHRIQISKTPPSLHPLGKGWLDRFRTRHPQIQGIWTRQIEGVRHNAISVAALKTWFDAVTELFLQHQYPAERIYNMDESGFAIGASQSSRALINVRERSSWKVIKGRQEWITAIECVSAAGVALPPLLIFKALHTNTAWIPADTPSDWRFSTSRSGWTSDSHAYEWLTTVFEPSTQPSNPTHRRLLTMDGHGSHITANVISFCMEKAIDLLILPPHTSHVLQPLDISVFAPLKRALATETDKASRLDAGRIQRVEWVNMYIRAREEAFTSTNIQSGWKATGLMPLSPITVLSKVQAAPTPEALPPSTPRQTNCLDLTLLHTSPPDGSELRRANAVFNLQLHDLESVPSPAKRYAKRMTHALEVAQSELVTLRKELAEQRELLQARKVRKKGKRVALKGKFLFSTQEVLDIARAAEQGTAAKNSHRRRHTHPPDKELSEMEGKVLENVSSDSEGDCIYVATRRQS